MIKKIGDFPIDRPWLTFIAVLVITFLLGSIFSNPEPYGLERNEEESESDWLPENDYVLADREIADNYGIQVKYMQLIVRSDNVLQKSVLLELLEIEKQVLNLTEFQNIMYPRQEMPPSVADVVAVGSMVMGGTPIMDALNTSVQDRIDALNQLNQSTIDAIVAFAGPNASMYLSKDFEKNMEKNVTKAKGTLVMFWLNASKYEEITTDDNPVLDAVEKVEKIVDDSKEPTIDRIGIIEEEFMNLKIEEESGGAMAVLFQGVFLLIIVILFLTYRSIFDTIISLMALMFAITWMNGIGVIMGLTFTTMYDAVPIMLMGLGIDYAIHLVMRYREERKYHGKDVRNALLITSASVGMALLLATLTTSISFGSNTVSEIKPMREFALFSLVGIVSAFIIMLTFVPSTKMIFHSWREKRKKNKALEGLKKGKGKREKPLNMERNDPLSRILAKGAVAAEHHAKAVIVFVIIVSLGSGYLSFQLDTEFDFTEFLPEDAEITDDIIYLTDNFDFGTEEANILVEGEIADPGVLQAMADTEANILDDRHVNDNQPIESILVFMRQTAGMDANFSAKYNASGAAADGVPDTAVAAIELFDYLRLDPRYSFQLVRVLHYNEVKGYYDGSVIRVGVNSQNGAYSGEIFEDMDDNIAPLEKLEDDGTISNVVSTSGPVLIHVIVRSIEISGLQSLAITVIVAGIILTIVFYVTDRSLALGILTEIPVILVIAWVFAGMYFAGMPLNVMTIMISSLTVGLGITYGIHVSHRFVEDLGKYDSIDEATRSTVLNTGMALFGAAMTTIGGFGILAFAPIPPLQKFGVISSLAIFFSLISSVFVLPTFLSVWAKYVKKKDPCYFQKHADVAKKIEEGDLACDTDEIVHDRPPVKKRVVKKKAVVKKKVPVDDEKPTEKKKPSEDEEEASDKKEKKASDDDETEDEKVDEEDAGEEETSEDEKDEE